jgi:hypothetical protein
MDTPAIELDLARVDLNTVRSLDGSALGAVLRDLYGPDGDRIDGEYSMHSSHDSHSSHSSHSSSGW